MSLSQARTRPSRLSRFSKGQASMEVLMLVGISLAFIIPIVLTFFSSSATRTQALSQVQATSLGQLMADTAGEVWYQGNGSKKGILVTYPDYLGNISVSGDRIERSASNPNWKSQMKYMGRELTITLDMEDGTQSQIVMASPAPMVNDWALAGSPSAALDQPRAGLNVCNPATNVCSGIGHVRPGLAYLIFENKGDYVSIIRNPQ